MSKKYEEKNLYILLAGFVLVAMLRLVLDDI